MKGCVTLMTFRMVNINNGITIKDPITGLGNLIAKAKNGIFHDLDKGVWVGKRNMGTFEKKF